jgi:hypothetical protein
MLAEAGKRVRVSKADGSKSWALTLVEVVDIDNRRELRLCNRSKPFKPDWSVSQRLWEAVVPAQDDECDYRLTIK